MMEETYEIWCVRALLVYLTSMVPPNSNKMSPFNEFVFPTNKSYWSIKCECMCVSLFCGDTYIRYANTRGIKLKILFYIIHYI